MMSLYVRRAYIAALLSAERKLWGGKYEKLNAKTTDLKAVLKIYA